MNDEKYAEIVKSETHARIAFGRLQSPSTWAGEGWRILEKVTADGAYITWPLFYDTIDGAKLDADRVLLRRRREM